jgi:hypothetical protein
VDLGFGTHADVNDAGTVVVGVLGSQPGGFVRWFDGAQARFPDGYVPEVIDDAGFVAGLIWQSDFDIDNRLFVWSDSNGDFNVNTNELLDYQIGSISQPWQVADINNHGVIVGNNSFRNPTSGSYEVAWRFSNGNATPLFHPDTSAPWRTTMDFTRAAGINDGGSIVGYAFNAGFSPAGLQEIPFQWDIAQGFTSLPWPSGFYDGVRALAINDAGRVVGHTSIPARATFWADTREEPQLLLPRGAISSIGTGLNNMGQVIRGKRILSL